MLNKSKIAAVCLMISVCSSTCVLFAESLDDLLGVGKTELKQARPETLKLWEDFITALEQSDFVKGQKLGTEFNAVTDFTEPYQKSFTSLVLDILKTKAATTAPAVAPAKTELGKEIEEQIASNKSLKDDAVAQITKHRTEIDQKKKDIEAEQKKLAAAEEKLAKKKKEDGVIGSVGGSIGGIAGQVIKGASGREDIEREIKACKEKIAVLQQDIREIEQKISQRESRIADLDRSNSDLKRRAEANNKENASAEALKQQEQLTVLQSKVLDMTKQLMEANNYRPAVVLATTYNRNIKEDAQLTTIAQQAVDFQKAQAKAVSIARAATTAVADALKSKRVWTAKSEFEKSAATIRERVTDEQLLSFISVEMGRIKRELESAIQTAIKKRDQIMDVARKDAKEAAKQFEAFRTEYTDYPEYEKDKTAIADLGTAQVAAKFEKRFAAIQEMIATDPDEAKVMISRLLQSEVDPDEISIVKARITGLQKAIVERKFDKKIAAIEAVIANDPAEAKDMVKKLLTTDIDPDQISLVKSKITALQRRILDGEVANIRKQMDEAQSYLTKFDVTYAEELKSGGKPTMDLKKSISTGVENLVRARSIQAGAVKQLEVLLQDEMDNVTKSKLVGLLETQKAALAQMDGTLKQAESSGKGSMMTLIIGGGVALLALIAGAAFIVLKRKK